MDKILLIVGIIIGMILYFKSPAFRHYFNLIIICTLKIPLHFFEWIEYRFGYDKPPNGLKIEQEYCQQVNEKTEKPIAQSKQTQNGLPDFDSMSDEETRQWIQNNTAQIHPNKAQTYN